MKTHIFYEMKYDLKGIQGQIRPLSCQKHIRLWTNLDEKLHECYYQTLFFHKIKYDLISHFYVMEKFCVFIFT